MDRKVFYNALRPTLGALTTPNVVGFEKFLDEGTRRGTQLDHMAYTLATVWWETGKTMQPVREAYWVKNAEAWRKKNLRYYPFYGRSYVQFTWETNYRKASDTWNSKYRQPGDPVVDFVKNPDLIMDPKYGVPLTFDGMENGWFTGKDMSDYLDGVDESDAEDFEEYRQARRIVNGIDKRDEIARLAVVFEKALRAAGWEWSPKPVPTPRPRPTLVPTDPVEPTAPPPSQPGSWIAKLIAAILAALKKEK